MPSDNHEGETQHTELSESIGRHRMFSLYTTFGAALCLFVLAGKLLGVSSSTFYFGVLGLLLGWGSAAVSMLMWGDGL